MNKDTQLGPPTMGDTEDEQRRAIAYGVTPHDDLAILRQLIPGHLDDCGCDFCEALARVEAELARLRSDKDERDWRTLEIVTKQAEAAEARCARLQQAAGYAEGVLMRDPFDEVQRQHAAQVLREALAGPDAPHGEGER